ncbi:MAG: hypothetical protein II333_07395 [Clostridia bacterium]|nr:hypothetical protein [Clostridia bacterium]
MKHRPTGEEMRERIVLFIFCGLIIIGFYIAIGLLVLPAAMETLSAWAETEKEDMLNRIIFLLVSVLYVVPLYMVYFNQSAVYKRFVLQETGELFEWKSLFRKFMTVHGCWDMLLYALYSIPFPLLLGINLKPIRQYIGFLYIQQGFFYELPVPGIAAYFLAVAGFILQYSAVFAFAAWRWDKQRLHRD